MFGKYLLYPKIVIKLFFLIFRKYRKYFSINSSKYIYLFIFHFLQLDVSIYFLIKIKTDWKKKYYLNFFTRKVSTITREKQVEYFFSLYFYFVFFSSFFFAYVFLLRELLLFPLKSEFIIPEGSFCEKLRVNLK